jgi:YHS domain-containing protein
MKLISISVFVFIVLTAIAYADTVKPVNVKEGIAIRGYDAVAYFKVSKRVQGNEQYQHTWNGATWYFSSEANRDAFAKDPEKYAPQFGGYCAYAASRDYIYDADPNFWKIVDGKLYLNFNGDAKKEWEKDIPTNIKKGNENWPDLMKGKATKS